ncbi:MAG TPA: sulfatase-like hydrolase/transferase, partial [Anaerolineales bacterium]
MIRHNPLKVILWLLVLSLGAAASSCATAPSASAPSAPAPSPLVTSTSTHKNIIFIITDDQNVDSLPVMRKLMSYPEGSWVNFTHAIVNDSICCPARASLLTGQYAFVSGVLSDSTGDRLDDTNTLPVWLNNAGYRTALVGKYLNNYPWNKGAGYIPPGWDSFQEMSTGKSAVRTDLAIKFIDSGTGPFFLYLAYMEPHAPTVPLPEYAHADVYVPPDSPNFNEADVSDKPAWIQQLSPISQADMDTWHKERVNSQRSLLGVDDSVQVLMDGLKARGLLDNTMILYLGDHGFSWGSHRWYKKECVYEECIRFPLLIRYPGLANSREEDRLVSNVDLASTIAEFAGITPGLPQSGHSLVPLINGNAANWQEAVFMEMHGDNFRTFDGIRVPGWTYAEYAN